MVNELRPRARQHELIVSNKWPTACRTALEKMLGHYLSHATAAGYNYRHVARCPRLTELPVDPSHERGRPHGVGGLVLVMMLQRDTCVESARRLSCAEFLLG